MQTRRPLVSSSLGVMRDLCYSSYVTCTMILFFARCRHRLTLRSILIALTICLLSQLTTHSISAYPSLPFPLAKGLGGRSVAQGLAFTTDLTAFHLLTAVEGWVLLDQQLYWTRDRGQAWLDITPTPLPNPLLNKGSAGAGYDAIRSAFFLNTRRGWLISQDGLGNHAIARTTDTGATWQTHKLSLFSSGDPDAFAAAIHLYFVNAQTGWLVTRRATSSAFDVGALFKTTDGGDTWTRLNIPIGDPVYFATADLGWVAGGAAHNQLYVTRDGGKSWQPVTLPCPSASALACSPARVSPRLP